MKAAKTYQGIIALSAMLFIAASCSSPKLDSYSRYALVVGIADYQAVSDLSYTDDDAREMADLLDSQGWDVLLLLDSQATKEGIRTAMASHFSGIEAGDTALVYYSGHGDAIGGTSYLAPWDTSWEASSVLDLDSLISPDEMSTWLFQGVVADNLILIMDACNSGGFIPDSESWDAIDAAYVRGLSPTTYTSPLRALVNFGNLLAKNATAAGLAAPIVLSAAGTAEESWEASTHQGLELELRNGVFTYFLLESAQRGDRNGDGFVTTTEAYTYAARAIDRYWNSYGGSNFHPHISGGLKDLVLFGF